MAAPRLKVGAFDFSPYLRTQPDESTPMDPADPGYFRPQFSGTPALGEGASWVADAVDNRTMSFPVYFTGADRAAIKQLIKEANEVLVKGAQVEFSIDPDVDSSSFFDLERGTIAEEFNFYHLVNTVAGAVLTLTCRPYAHTATHRLIASVPAATSAVVKFAATGIDGDAYALTGLEVRVGSAVASAGRVIAWGVHPHPSHNPYRAATSGLAQTGATVRGASGAIGSQYTAIPISPTGASGISYQVFLDPPDAHIGRHRVIAVARSGLSGGIPLWAEDRFGAVLGPTAIASQIDVNKWQLVDLGTVSVPMRASGQDPVPTQLVNIRGGGASGYEINASPAFHLNGIMLLPLDYSAGILRTKGAGGPAALYQDNFIRILGAERLEEHPVAEQGGNWNVAAGVLGGPAATGLGWKADGKLSPGVNFGLGAMLVAANASGLGVLASGALNADVVGQVGVGLTAASGIASPHAASAVVALYPKAQTNASAVVGGVGARLQLGPSQTLQIVSASANGATAVIASAGIASSLASGLYLGQQHNLVMRVLGAQMDVWLATGALAASPVLSASHANALQLGWPALAINAGSNVASGVVYADALNVQAIGPSAPDIGARETFRFESHPEGRVYQGTASVFTADRLADYHGQFPKLPPVPSSTATGPARVVVFQGEVDNVQGLDGPDLALTVLERFRFLR